MHVHDTIGSSTEDEDDISPWHSVHSCNMDPRYVRCIGRNIVSRLIGGDPYVLVDCFPIEQAMSVGDMSVSITSMTALMRKSATLKKYGADR